MPSYNSRVEYTGVTGTAHSYSGVRLLNDRLVTEQSQLIVTKNGTELSYVASAPTSVQYTLNKTTKVLTLGAALVTTDVLLIRRSTKQDALHVDFENNSPLAEDDLDLALNQLLFIAQEAQERIAVDAAFSFSGQLLTFRNGGFTLEQKAAFTYDIESFTVKLSGGTCTAKLAIDGVDVTNSSLSCTSTEVSNASALAANRVLVGQTLTIAVSLSTPSGTENLAFSAQARKV